MSATASDIVSDEVSTNRKRVKVGATLDPGLVTAVDAYVTDNPGTDRSAVIDEALRLWHERQQERAMERQLREDATRYDADRADWKRVRLAAARRRFAARK
jgi:Arc/MetJ-type ribon-helix-helix transcriptional regulator